MIAGKPLAARHTMCGKDWNIVENTFGIFTISCRGKVYPNINGALATLY